MDYATFEKKHEEFQEDPTRNLLRSLVRGMYDLQDLRLRNGGRLVAIFKDRIGQKSGTRENDIGTTVVEAETPFANMSDNEREIAEKKAKRKQKEAGIVLTQLRKEFKRITDGIGAIRNIKKPKASPLIHSRIELMLAHEYFELLKQEGRVKNDIKGVLLDIPVWQDFLQGVKGVGPGMSGVLLSFLDPYKAQRPSGFCKYCGLDVVTGPDGETIGRSTRKAHRVSRVMLVKDGETGELVEKSVEGLLSYNPWVKKKVAFVLPGCLLKSGKATNDAGGVEYKNVYAQRYDEYKHRITNTPKHADKRPAHINAMAMRYMAKALLIDLHVAWRTAECIPVSVPYHEGVLGHVHGG